MNGTWVVARREIRSYVDSPVAYLFIVAFLVSCSVLFFFMQGFFAAGVASLRPWFGLMPIMLSILLPALTMRMWAEERKQGTYETLLTLPLSEGQLVLGKYLAAMTVLGAALILSLPVPIMVSAFGRFDPGIIVAEYLGIVLLSSASIALGQLVSSLTRNQMSAFLATALVLVAMTMLSQLAAFFSLPSWLSAMVNWLSLSYRFSSFSKGVVDSRDCAYFIILSAMCLYLTTRRIAFGKWS